MAGILHHYEDFVARPNGIYQGLANLPWRSVMRLRVEAFRRLLLEGVEMADLQWNPEYSESA
jgi:CRISPR-associated protein Cas1